MFAVYSPEPEYTIYNLHYRPTTHYYVRPFRRQYFYAPDSIYDAIYTRENGCRRAQLQHAREQAYQQWLIDQKRKHEALKQAYARRTAANCQQSNNNKTGRRIPIKVDARQEAARRIVDFLERRNAIHHTRAVLHKLSYLRKIQTQLKVLQNQYKSSAISLIFRTEHAKKVLPISENNKFFLKHEDAIFKLLDLLDRIETKGVDIVRKRRKEVVDLAQEMLEELDQIKETQWKAFIGTDDQEKKNITIETITNDKASSVDVETKVNDTNGDLSDYQHAEASKVNDTNGDLSDYQHVEEATLPESNNDTVQPYLITEPAPTLEINDNTTTTQKPESEALPNDNTSIKPTVEQEEIESTVEKEETESTVEKGETESTITDSTPQTLEIETTLQPTEQASSAIDEEEEVRVVKESEDESNIDTKKPEVVNNEEDFVIVNDNEWTE